MKYCLLLSLCFLDSFFAFGELIITEVFSNPVGRVKNGQWIELYNKSPKRILVKNVHIAISTGKKKDIIYNKTINLEKYIPFDDMLIIAQDDHLGLELCLNLAVITIEDKEFIIPKDRIFSMCINVNDEPFACAHFSAKDKFPDGVSLHPNILENNNEEWLSEECQFGESSKATPGFLPDVCLTESSFLEDIILDCREQNQNVKLFKMPPEQYNFVIEDIFTLSHKQKDVNKTLPVINRINNKINIDSKIDHIPFNYIVIDGDKILQQASVITPGELSVNLYTNKKVLIKIMGKFFTEEIMI